MPDCPEKMHIKETHGDSIKNWEPETCVIQAAFESNNMYYPVTVPSPSGTSKMKPAFNDQIS